METTKQVLKSAHTPDQYTYIRHKSGLDILVCEMAGYSTTEAMFSTKYGSIHTQFKTDSDSDYCAVPEGIAHFLEHKLFENEDTDVFTLFAQTGANANAYTSFDKTCYFFSCSDNFTKSLEILLTFVQEPYFTPESVAKEQGIIGQEIAMCNDDPSWRVLFNMLGGLYENHPVRIDIAGTQDSIAQITDDLLYRCYHTFYNLHNMVLVVAGNCTVNEVLEVADRTLKPCKTQKLETIFPDEPRSIVRSETVETAAVGQPLFQIGIKCRPFTESELLRAQMTSSIMLELLIGTSSPLYQSLLADGLINANFSSEVFAGDGYFALILDGESPDPYAVRDRIRDAIIDAKKSGLDLEHFEEYQKSTYGDLVRELGNVDAVVNSLTTAHMAGYGLYDPLQMLTEMKPEDCNIFLNDEIDVDCMTLSIVKPAQE